MSGQRALLTRLRTLRAHDSAPLSVLVRLVASELVSEVCSIYVQRPGDILELGATEGLNACAVGQTRLRVGEGIIGLCAATGSVMNLPDAQNHPAFAYRPETGEEPFASLLAVPVRRSGRVLGVLAVQNRAPRNFTDAEIEDLETVAMLLAEMLPNSGATDGSPEGLGATVPRQFKGTPLMPGIAVGPVVLLRTARPVTRLLSDNPKAEQKRLEDAIEQMRRGLDDLFADVPNAGRAADVSASREVLEAYRLVAADAGWMHRVSDVIRSGLTADAAVQRVAQELHDRMRRISDPYLRERLADMEDLAGRLLNALSGEIARPAVPQNAILVARRLGPAELLDWHGRGIVAVAVEEASPAGHAAILARALGIPALGGMRGMLDATDTGDQAVVDADEGQFILRPDSEVRQAYTRAQESRSAKTAELAKWRDRRAITADSVALRLMLNVGLNLEMPQLARTGADGIGLFRTEIAMLARGSVADVADQAAIYARILDEAGDKPVLFRTLDLGADKLLPGTINEEENPAMGWRSLRVGLDRPALLRRQLRALLLAAGGRPLSVMFPMVATVGEFIAAKSLLLAEASRIHPASERLQIGSMLEIPSLMWQLPGLLAEADFISVGSNDLLQFLFAADRGTPSLYERYDFLSPPMLDLLEQLVVAAQIAGKPVSLCGEAASHPLEALVLAALGIHTLSMPASGILGIKAMFSQVDLGAFQAVLGAMRRAGEPGLREAITIWAREQQIIS
jgi:phosphotransferase system, enzyme I, PtsP